MSADRTGERLADALGRVRLVSLAAGVAGALLCAAGWAFFPHEFFPAYLVAFLFWLGISLGALAVVMLHQLTGGGWGQPIRRTLEATFATIPLMGVLFLAVVLGMPYLYEWSKADVVAHDAVLQKKSAYLNVEGFLIRAAVSFGLWLLFAGLMSWMTRGEKPVIATPARDRLGLVAGLGLILWTLSTTFASVDWAMSLEPHWFSSMYGVLYMAGQGVSGLAFGIIVTVLLARRAGWPESLTVDRLHDLGNLLLAFVLFWSYVATMQYLIIWSGNLPEETPYYVHRTNGGWEFVALALIVLHFLLPFLLLLWRQTKRRPEWLLGVAALILVMRWVDLTWQVVPASRPERVGVSWLHFVTPVAIGGLWLSVFAWRLPARAALPEWESVEEEDRGDEFARQPAH
jgi:hypothetical protein